MNLRQSLQIVRHPPSQIQQWTVMQNPAARSIIANRLLFPPGGERAQHRPLYAVQSAMVVNPSPDFLGLRLIPGRIGQRGESFGQGLRLTAFRQQRLLLPVNIPEIAHIISGVGQPFRVQRSLPPIDAGMRFRQFDP